MITVTTSTSRKMINLSSKPNLADLDCQDSRQRAMVIFAMVLLMTIVMSSCLGKLISLLICFSGWFGGYFKIIQLAAVSERMRFRSRRRMRAGQQ